MLSYIKAIPAKMNVSRSECLNVLGGVVNDGAAQEAEISTWANAGDGWKRIVTRSYFLGAGEHRHLYFTLFPEVFSEAYWGEEPQELEIIIRDTAPEPGDQGAIVFIE